MLIEDRSENDCFREWQVASGEKLSFRIERYKTNCCGLTSFEQFDWRYQVELDFDDCVALLKLAEDAIQAGTGIIASIPEEKGDDYYDDPESWRTLNKAFRTRGFRCIKRFRNSNSGNFVKLFFKLATRS